VRLMICENCSNWKCEKLTFKELKLHWHESIGGLITPGHLKRYRKEAEIQNIPLENVRIGYKYCSAGILNRFYLMKRDSDCTPSKKMDSCPSFSSENGGLLVNMQSPLWQICTCETHGISEVKGISFAPGLYEDHTYTRIPFYDDVRPRIESRNIGCSVCGNKGKRSIVIRFEKSFCCNKHYLEWWAKRHREEFRRLNK